ncbi:titin-like isoform X1 [Astatotilapia calliptera]|nr:titin-like isoform X1 [Astatotilapia calliptera]XP_026032014.1 titin-like isoform X1 [Astatotilapia calliptera]
MRLTALCVCGTLLAFSSLSWITADSDEGILLVDKGFGPCTVTLTPGGQCRQVQHENTCPYLLTLPPLRIHLPQQFKELEKIVEDLQKLKDSVDELREICADCTVSQTERECGRHRENERETLSEETDRREDDRNWVNERLQENGFKQECSTVSVMEGDGDSEKTGTLEEKERKKWETERESNGGLIKETLTEVLETDGTTQSDRGKGKDKVVPTKVTTGGVNEGTVGEKVADKNNRQGERDRNKDTAGEENSKGYQENNLEHGKERKTFTNVNKTEESGHHVWQDKTEETETQTAASDRIKISENHDENTNQEQEQSREEKKKEMEKRVQVEQNNEERKQTEKIRHTEKEKTIKEGGEGRETGKEIKTEDEETESGEGDDRELPSSEATKRTDFVSISPTPHSTINIALGLDSVDSNEATSSIPSPPMPSSTLHYITDVSHEITTQNTGLVAAGISKPPKADANTHTETTMSTGSGQHITNQTTTSRSGLHSHISSTTTTTVTTAHHQDLTVGAIDDSRWTAKKNISSNTKIGAKPLPGQGPKPGKRPKYNQKKHPFHHKPRIDQRPKPQPGKDPKGVETSKPKQRIPPHILPTDQNLNNDSIPKYGQNYTSDQNKLPTQKSKPNEKTVTPIWTPPPHHRPQNANTAGSDEYPDQVTATNQTEIEPKSEKGIVHNPKTEKPDQNQKIEKWSKGGEKTTTDQKPGYSGTSDENPTQVSYFNQDSTPRKKTTPDLTKTPPNQKSKITQIIPTKPKPVQEPESKESPTASYAEKAKQNETSDENPSQVPYSNQDPISGKKTTPDLPKTPPNQKPKITQIIPTKPKHVQEPESKESPTASYTEKAKQNETSDENPLHVSNSNQDSTPRKKTTPDLPKTPPKEKPKTRQNIPTKPKPVQEPESKESPTASYAEKAKQNETSDENPSQVPYSNQDPISGKKTTPDLPKTPPNQKPKITQIIPTKPKHVQEPESKESPTASYTEKPEQKQTSDENPSQVSNSNQDSTPRKKTMPDLMKTLPNEKPKTRQNIPTKPKPVQDRESKESRTANYTEKAKQNETSDEYPSHVSNSNQDSTPRKKTTTDLLKTPPKEKPKTRQNIPTKPKPVQEPKSKVSPTASYAEKAKQNETSDENPMQVSYSNQDPISGKKTIPDLPKTPPNQKPKTRQNIPTKPKHVQEPESKESPTASYTEKPKQKETSDENPSQVSNSNQDSTPRKKTTPDLLKTPPKEKPKTRQNIPTKPKPVQEPESKVSPTANYAEKAKQNETSDENPMQVSYSNQDPISGKKTIPDLPKTPPNQKPKTRQNIPTKPKPVQEPKSKESLTASYAEKAKQNETSDENPSQVPYSNQDPISGKKTTPDLPKTPPNQKPKITQIIPTKPKHVQEPESKESPTASYTEKPKQKQTSDENPSQVSNSNQDSTPRKKTTPDLLKTLPKEKPKTRQNIPTKPKPVQEPESKVSPTASYAEKAKQNETSDENPSQVSYSNQDPTSGKKTTPDLLKTPPKEKPKTRQNVPTKPKLVQEPESKESPTARYTEKPKQNETSDENPSHVSNSNQDLITGKKTMPDLLKTPPNQKPKTSQNIPVKPKPTQTSESKDSPTASYTEIPNQRETFDENLSYISNSTQDSTSGKKTMPDLPKTPGNQKPKITQIIPTKPKPVQEPESKESPTASYAEKAKQNETSDEYPSHVSNSNQDPTFGKKTISDLMKTPPNQKPKTRQKISTKPKPVQEPESKESPTVSYTEKPKQKETSDENPSHMSNSNQDPTPGKKTMPEIMKTPPNQKPKTRQNIPTKPKPDQVPNQPSHTKPGTSFKPKPNVRPKTGPKPPETSHNFKTPKLGETPNLNAKPAPRAESNRTSKPRLPFIYRPRSMPTVRPGAPPVQRPKPAVQPKLSPKTKTDPPNISWTTSDHTQTSQINTPSTSGPIKHTAEVTHSPGDREFNPSLSKTVTPGPKTSNSLENGAFPHLQSQPKDSTMSPNNRIVSDLRPQTASQPASIPMTTKPNKIISGILTSVIPSTTPGSSKSKTNSGSDTQTEKHHKMEEIAPAFSTSPSPISHTISPPSPDFRSTTATTPGPKHPELAAEASTPSARELRVKINQVAAFFNNSLSPNGRPPNIHHKDHSEENQGGIRPDNTDGKLPTDKPPKVTMLPRDCSDHLLRGKTKSGLYLVTPDLRTSSFSVYCEMEQEGGGWTVLQRRQDGSVNFNRTWAEYQSGFGELDRGEFWLGNNIIHLLTRDREMVLRVELEDFDGLTGYAQYEQFKVASERLRYRLTVGSYSGTAGNALRFSKKYDHSNRAFTTPDRDHDRYPSGNCGAYYSSGWWFDACMSANLNGRYYDGRYKGVRNGIFWGTWHNILSEYYPTNERQSFKRVRMMIRPKDFVP